MKVMTVLGTRPEIIRLSLIIPLLDQLCEHCVVHTGQNYDRTLNEIFFEELGLRQPDYVLDSRANSMMGQIGKILSGCEELMAKEKPDKLLILGDTNSALSAIVAKRMGIPVYHMEAGNRCFDDRVPEEVNRRIVDHCSDILLPYTERSRANLLREGIPGNRIFVTGNPIKEVLDQYSPKIKASLVLGKLGLSREKYFLVTLHRAENVDVPARLDNYLTALYRLYDQYNLPVICSLHPRTRSQLIKQGKQLDERKIIAVEPFGLFDFVHLEQNAFCVLSDSGTVQEECCLFNVPNVTLRDVTERPETIEAGSNVISGSEVESVLRSVQTAVTLKTKFEIPREYLSDQVSHKVTRIIVNYFD